MTTMTVAPGDGNNFTHFNSTLNQSQSTSFQLNHGQTSGNSASNSGSDPFANLPVRNEMSSAEVRHILRVCGQQNPNFYYNSSRIEKLAIKNIHTTTAYVYSIETFTEKRQIGWSKKSYDPGQPFDGPENGTPPDLFNIPCVPEFVGRDSVKYIKIPHTDSIEVCRGCVGTGGEKCSSCDGMGRKKCYSCNGTGMGGMKIGVNVVNAVRLVFNLVGFVKESVAIFVVAVMAV
jgi:hypothetical protein